MLQVLVHTFDRDQRAYAIFLFTRTFIVLRITSAISIRLAILESCATSYRLSVEPQHVIFCAYRRWPKITFVSELHIRRYTFSPPRKQFVGANYINHCISTSASRLSGLLCSDVCHKDFSLISNNTAARKLPNNGSAPIAAAPLHHFATLKCFR